jgi:hypothetical protein
MTIAVNNMIKHLKDGPISCGVDVADFADILDWKSDAIY